MDMEKIKAIQDSVNCKFKIAINTEFEVDKSEYLIFTILENLNRDANMSDDIFLKVIFLTGLKESAKEITKIVLNQILKDLDKKED